MGKVIVTSLKFRKRVLEYNLKRGPGIFGHLDSCHAISVEDPALLPIHSRIFVSVVIKYVKHSFSLKLIYHTIGCFCNCSLIIFHAQGNREGYCFIGASSVQKKTEILLTTMYSLVTQ